MASRKQSKWRYIATTEQRLTRWKWGIAGWIVLTVAVLAGQEYTLQQHRHELKALKAQGELQHRLDEMYARTLTLAPQEAIQLSLGGRGYAVITPAYGYYGVMDPSCQVHRQQEPPPSQVRQESEGAQHVLTYNRGTQTWTIPGSVSGRAVVTTTGFSETNTLAGTATVHRLARE